jgi:hypothetical protein
MGGSDTHHSAFDNASRLYRAQAFFKQSLKLIGAAWTRAGFLFIILDHAP